MKDYTYLITPESAKEYNKYRNIQRHFLDYFDSFYQKYNGYSSLHAEYRLNILSETHKKFIDLGFYYKDYVFDIQYNEELKTVEFSVQCTPDVSFYKEKPSIIICDFVNFDDELFVNWILKEKESNEFKDQLIKFVESADKNKQNK